MGAEVRKRISFAAVDELSSDDPTCSPHECKFGNPYLDHIIKKSEYESMCRQPWVDSLAAKLTSQGGWGINFSNLDKEDVGEAKLVETLSLHATGCPGIMSDVKVLDNVLPGKWCEKMIAANESVGYVSQQELELTVGSDAKRLAAAVLQTRKQMKAKELGLSEDEYQIGKNTSQVFEAWSPEFAKVLWDRISEFVPATISVGTLRRRIPVIPSGVWRAAGIIPAFRFMKYEPGAAFKAHRDPARVLRTHPMTGEPGLFRSFVTIAVFLNEYGSDFDGGQLAFVKLQPNPAFAEKEVGMPALVHHQLAAIHPGRSRCVVFEHDQVHESTPIMSGV